MEPLLHPSGSVELCDHPERLDDGRPGDGFAHYCRVHECDQQCEGAPGACVAYCGYQLYERRLPDGTINWNHGKPTCVVCDHMEGVA